MSERQRCPRCPTNSERCAHLGGDWVRLQHDGEYEAPWGVFWSWPSAGESEHGFYYFTWVQAGETYDKLETELREPRP